MVVVWILDVQQNQNQREENKRRKGGKQGGGLYVGVQFVMLKTWMFCKESSPRKQRISSSRKFYV